MDGILLTTTSGLNAVQGNLVGVGANGTLPLGNQRSGIRIEGTENLIGGPSEIARNVISANGRNGIDIVGATATGNRVQRDVIGADAGGTASLGNAGHGVYVEATGANVIGDALGGTGAGNTIAFNDGGGIVLASGASAARGVAILGNVIYGNGQLGVDLGDDGVTPNDPRDADDGPNRLQNYPTLSAVVVTGSSTMAVGGLASTPNATFTVQLFANSTCDPSGFGQGRLLVASGQATTDATGAASLNIPLAAGVRGSDWITATATDAQGNTSEFSPCRSATPPPPTATPAAPFFPLG
jgi:titin